MNARVRRTVTVLLLSTAGWTGTSLGQDGLQRAPQAAEGPRTATSPNTTISVDFSGGTVGEYIAALRTAAGETPVNVIITEEARLAKMGPVSLKLVPIRLAVVSIKAAAEITDPLGRWDVEVVREPREDRGIDGPEGTGRRRIEVFRVQFQKRAPEPSDGERPQFAFATRSLTAARLDTPEWKLSPETLLSAIRAAVELHDAESGQTTKLVFHPESGALLLSGTRFIGEQVRGLLREFEEQQRDWSRREHESLMQNLRESMKLQIDELNAEIAALRVTVRANEVERTKLRAEIKELTAKDKGVSSPK